MSEELTNMFNLRYFLEEIDVKLYGFTDDNDIIHIQYFTSRSPYITLDNICEFLKAVKINYVYEGTSI